MNIKFVFKTLLVFSLALGGIIKSSANSPSQLTDEQGKELMQLIKSINHRTVPYQATVLQSLVGEGNFLVHRLELPTPQPITPADVKNTVIFDPWYATVKEKQPPFLPDTIYGVKICSTNIPREQRLKSLKITASGVFETTNYFFSFRNGWLCDLQHLSEHNVEYYSRDLDKLVGKPSLIDTNGAFQLATQWLAAVGIDVAKLTESKWTINQLHYLERGATNAVTLPLFYVDFDSHHFPAVGARKAFDEPLVSVEILGTTKQLQEIRILDDSFWLHPQMIITNALELVQAPTGAAQPQANPLK